MAKLNSAYDFRNEIQTTDEQLREKITTTFNSDTASTSVHIKSAPKLELKPEQDKSIVLFDDAEPTDTSFDNFDIESIAPPLESNAEEKETSVVENNEKPLPKEKPALSSKAVKRNRKHNRDEKKLMCDVCGKICLYKGMCPSLRVK